MELPRQIEFCTYKYSDQGFCFSRKHFTRAPLNSWEAAMVGEAGQKLVRALARVTSLVLDKWSRGSQGFLHTTSAWT